MAKQKGPIILEGPMGEDVYYIDPKHGPLKRRKTSVNAERIRKDAAFVRVRENNNDFRRGAALVKAIRAAFHPIYAPVADQRMTSRLTSAVMTAIRADNTHAPGNRSILHGDITSLQGLDFNKESSVTRLLRTPYTVAPGEAQGTTITSFKRVIPTHHLYAPAGATHYRVVSSVAWIDPATGRYVVHTATSIALPAKGHVPVDIFLTNALPTEHGTLRLHVLGIEFLQETNGNFYRLANKTFHALTLVGVEIVPARVVRKVKKHRIQRPVAFLERHFRRPVDRAGIPRGLQSTSRSRQRGKPESPTDSG